MDLESLETQTLLNKRTPKHQSFALKLAVLLCGLGLFVGVAVPSTNRGDLQGKATLKEKEVTAAAGVSSTSRPASTMSMDWRAAAVAAPAWSVEDHDTSRAPFGYCARGGGFRMMSMGFLGNIREARGVAGRRRGTDHRSVARGRAPFDVVSLSKNSLSRSRFSLSID